MGSEANQPAEEIVCAVPDSFGVGQLCRWSDGKVSYCLVDLIGSLGEDETRKTLREVYDHIASECGIQVSEQDVAARARVLVTAGKIDGPGGTLAWAQLPCGNIRQSVQKFDAGERRWVIHPEGPFPAGTMDFWRVCLHETLHSLGLPHGGDDIMKPAIDPRISRIGNWTREELRRRYGPPRNTPVPEPTPGPAPTPGGSVFMDLIAIVKAALPLAKLLAAKTATPIDDVLVGILEKYFGSVSFTAEEVAQARAAVEAA